MISTRADHEGESASWRGTTRLDLLGSPILAASVALLLREPSDDRATLEGESLREAIVEELRRAFPAVDIHGKRGTH